MSDISPGYLYDIRVLKALITSLVRPSRFFLDRVFGSVTTFDTLTMDVDVEVRDKRMSAFCHPEVEGVLVGERGYKTEQFTPAYIKELKILSPKNSFKRRAGETIGTGSMSPYERSVARVNDALLETSDAIIQRKEFMAVSALLTGTVTVSGKGYETKVVDFHRDPSLTITLAPASRWDSTTTPSNPVTEIEKYCNAVAVAGGGVVTDIVLDPVAWAAALNNEQFRRDLHTLHYAGAVVQIGPNADETLVAYKGVLGTVRLWVYQDYYLDPITLTNTPFLPAGTIVGFGGRVQGQQLHGAIQDEEAGLQALELFPKSELRFDPSARVILVQSAPLVAPYRPNNTFSAKVAG